jgi:hypothetical protein
METRAVWVTLDAPDTAGAPVAGIMQHFTSFDRMKRAAAVMGIAVLGAAALIPIPIIHLLGIPLLLLTGALLAGRQLASSSRLQPLRIPCPKCGGVNRVGGGFGYRDVSGPIDRTCDSCRRGLTLRFTNQ